MLITSSKIGSHLVLCLALVLFAGCVQEKSKPAAQTGGGTELNGEINIEGSSTVEPVTAAIAEEFGKLHKDIKLSVKGNGSGSGFKALYRGEVPIADASRAIKDSEKEECKKNKIEYIEISVATDGLTVVVNKDNTWCDKLTVAQLKTLWEPNSKIKKWNQLDPSWPDAEIKLFAPDTESGTFDYFTEEIVGEAKASRSDYTPSANDNVLVQGVSGEKNALGYFGFAYYQENAGKLKAVAISSTDSLDDAVAPTLETVESGEYKPLSRPLFIYVNTASLTRPEVVSFLNFYLEKGQQYVKEVGYVGLNPATLTEMKNRLKAAIDAAKKK